MLIGIFFMMCFVAILIISIGTSIIRGILNLLFGIFGGPKKAYGPTAQSHRSGQQTQSQTQQSASPSDTRRDKIFDKNDGEYVDFEEIKE